MSSKTTSSTENPAPRRRGRPAKPKVVIPFVDGIPDGEVVEVELASIDLEDTEFEFRVDHKIKDLVDDLQQNGQQFPVILRPGVEEGKYQLVSGFRRCRALVALEWPTVKAIVRHDLDDDKAFAISFLENDKRKSLTGVDKAHAIVKLRLKGKSDDEIMAIYGIGDKQLDRYKKVSTFPDVLKGAISDGKIATTHGLALNRAFEAHGNKMNLEAWIQRVFEEELSVRKLTRDLNAEFGKPKKQKRYMDRKGERGFRLYPMLFDPEKTHGATKKKMIGVLQEALAKLEGKTSGSD